MQDQSPQRDTNLALTEPVEFDEDRADVTETMIRRLVDAFYIEIREDSVLGPIFERHVEDWSAHLPKMYDFWSTVLLRTGRYSGRPLEVHERMLELSAAHFERWLMTWKRVVARDLPGPIREAFTVPASRMACTMASKLAVG